MAVSLTNANGDPVSTFGSGNSAYAQGDKTNTFESQSQPFDYADDKSAPTLLSPRTFGDTADVNAGTSTPTSAGDTQSFGYTNDPRSAVHDTRGSRGSRGGGGGGGSGDGGAGIKLNPDEPMGIPAAKPGKAPDPAHPDGPTENDQAETAVAQENMRQGNPPDLTLHGNFGAGASTSRPGGDMPGTTDTGLGSYTDGGSYTSDTSTQE